MIQRQRATLILTLLAASLGGCAKDPSFTQLRSYPSQLNRLEPGNIQLYRADTKVKITNTTAHNIGPSTIWLNQWFAHDIEGLGIGQTLTLTLSTFKDEYGDPFHGGGFFATQAPDQIVLAELETKPNTADPATPSALLPLIVVGQRKN